MRSSLIDLSSIPAPEVVINRQRLNAALILEVSGTVDMVTGPQLLAAVRSALAEGPEKLVIDLTGVTFLAAAGLHILDVAREEAGDAVVLAVVAHGPATARPIEITGLDVIVDLYPTVDDVMSSHAA